MENITYNEAGGTDRSPFLTVKLSWVAYISDALRFFLRLFIFLVIAIPFTHFNSPAGAFGKGAVAWPTLAALALASLWTVYSVMYTASIRVFTDDGGVWLSSGVFPWQKGVSGVQWRDVGQAGFMRGALSWALKSYQINVSHRFTTGAELSVKHVKYGDQFVQHVNGVMASIQRRGL